LRTTEFPDKNKICIEVTEIVNLEINIVPIAEEIIDINTECKKKSKSEWIDELKQLITCSSILPKNTYEKQ
jgi:hypothetical protein